MKKKSIIAAFIGHALEHYDITLYGFFASFLGTVFFPSHDPMWITISSLAVFAAGFVMRPFGGIIFGYIGDRLGRKTALLWSILLVSIPTLIIGILPSYETIGIIAPVILILSRLLQGLCVGGEYSGAAIFVAEHALKKRSGFYGSILCTTGFLGAVLGTGIGSICMSENELDWKWRIPFILGGVFGLIGVFYRQQIEETPIFQKIKPNKKLTFPLLEILKIHRKNVFCTMAIGANGLIPLYLATVYINVIFSTKFNFSTSYILSINAAIMSLWVLFLPIMGWLSDKIGQVKLMSISAFITALIAFPLFIYLNYKISFEKIIIFQIILTIVGTAYVGSLTSLLPKLFPSQMRYSGVAFSYTLGQAIFGGTAPLIAKLLVDWSKNESAPAIYLCFGAIIGWIGVRKANIFPDKFINKDFQMAKNILKNSADFSENKDVNQHFERPMPEIKRAN